MLFNTVNYFVFFFVVLALFYTVPRSWRKALLLAASYFFYMSWNPKFIVLLLTLTVVDYIAAIWIERSKPGPRKKLSLIFSLAANLGFLAFFKYFNFAASNVAFLLGRPENAFFRDIVLPLGISFHTFQSMSYVVDVYRGEQEVIRKPLDYALFIAFFPQLVAGPIVRAKEFFVDLYHWRPPSSEEVQQAAFLILIGLTKKMVLADQFAKVADVYFRDVSANPGMLTAWSGVVAFAMQIFFDFSGYTDMAIGCAKLLGFHFPLNFARPYLAFSITEFWHRWHISLSRWLRDYLYIPLGGNRHGAIQTYRNLMLTMLLGGLWHGASWNFLVWGGFHGLLLSIERMIPGWQKAPAWMKPPRAILTFALVCIGWVFFRASTLHDSLYVVQQMFSGATGKMLLERWHIWMIAIALILAILEETKEVFERIAAAPRWVQVAAIVTIFFSLEIFGVTDEKIPFIYFQF